MLPLITTLGDLIDTIVAIYHGFAALFQAMLAILRLIGRLAGGRGPSRAIRLFRIRPQGDSCFLFPT